MKKISLEEYLTFNVGSRRAAIRLLRMRGFPRPKDERQMMEMLADVRRDGDEEDIIALAKIHPDYELIKFAVESEKENDNPEEKDFSNCSGQHSNCSGCAAAMSSANGQPNGHPYHTLNNLMGYPNHPVTNQFGIHGEFDGTWLPSADGRMYYMGGKTPSSNKKTIITKSDNSDNKFYITLTATALFAGLLIYALKTSS